MSAESMLFNGAILSTVLILVGLSLGFLILKIQGGEPE
ncbi:PetM family cytochrome b6-f complex subunit 7 [Pleurocapsa sp. PCC 7319]|nr:PetM family cytochrome b6-f complex subunit 7 [Pleurocapsa sp. PCC 7319]